LQEAHAALSVSLVHDRVCGVYFIYFILNKKRKRKEGKRRKGMESERKGRRKKPRQTEILPSTQDPKSQSKSFSFFPEKKQQTPM